MGKDVTLWCNATGYPRPVVYWTREDSHRKLSDGTYQFWVRQVTSFTNTNHFFNLTNAFSESKIEAQTSPARVKVRVGKDFTLWCNATGYPRAVVYWTREDNNRRLKDGSYQFWVRMDTGEKIYRCCFI